MKDKLFYTGLIIFLILLSITVYITQLLKLPIDFSSFYASIDLLKHHQSPYQIQLLHFLNSTKNSTLNLNTPFFIMLISPLALLSYMKALYIWQTLSMFALVYAGVLVLKMYPKLPKYYLLALLFSYPVLMNFLLGQLASFIFLFIIIGYKYQKLQKHKVAGVFWGLATAVKLFPGLLLIYALSNKKYKLSLSLCLTVLIAFLIPYFMYGLTIYKEYFAALNQVYWYGHNWNGSVYGYVFRIFSDAKPSSELITCLKIYASGAFIIFSLIYLSVIFRAKNLADETKFNLTIICMIFLSPLGWLYYFPLLFAPCLSLLNNSDNYSYKRSIALLSCLALVMLPQNSYLLPEMKTFINKLTIYSQYFYGLFLMIVLMISKPKPIKAINTENPYYIFNKTLSLVLIYGYTIYIFGVNLGKLIVNYSSLTMR